VSSGGVAIAAREQGQGIPRQIVPGDAAIQGIVRTDAGFGLGRVTVLLQNLSNGPSLQTSTTGDRLYGLLNLTSGRYQVKATCEGFKPFACREIELSWGGPFFQLSSR
jgi:hypothetical protein